MESDEWEEEEGFDLEDEGGCDYGVTSICSEPQTKDMNLCTTECQAYLCALEIQADGGTKNWVCSECGCTDNHACSGGCHWVRRNLCSACAEKAKQQYQSNMNKSISEHVRAVLNR